MRLEVCNVSNLFEVGKPVQVFDWIFVSVEFMTLSGFNASWRAANSQILLSCNVTVCRMVKFDVIKSPTVRGKLLSASKFGAMERVPLWHCQRHERRGVYTVDSDES